MQREFDSLLQLMNAIPDEDAAIEHFTAIRWANGAYCPLCGSTKVYHFADKKTHKCGDCRKRFSIKVGTVFEATKIPLRTWLMAIWLLTSHKKGVASTTLAKDLKVTQKTAWFMTQRLRKAAESKSFNGPLSGYVEADETFVGGKERNKHKADRKAGQQGGKGKEMVVGVLERGGDLRAFHVDRETDLHVQSVVTDNVQEGSNLFTDESPYYVKLPKHYFQYSVSHSAGEYVRDGFIHINSLEGAWSLLKRQIYGIHHWVSPKHLNRYVSEMTWRYNRRAMGEGDRVNALIAGSDGRLTYKALIA